MQRKGHDGVCGGQCVGVIMDDPKRDTIIEKDNYYVGVCVFYLCHQSLFNDEIAVRPYSTYIWLILAPTSCVLTMAFVICVHREAGRQV